MSTPVSASFGAKVRCTTHSEAQLLRTQLESSLTRATPGATVAAVTARTLGMSFEMQLVKKSGESLFLLITCQQRMDAEGRVVTESVIALTCTMQVSRCCDSSFNMLAVEFWLCQCSLRCLCRFTVYFKVL